MSTPRTVDETTLRTSLQSLAARLGKTPTVVEMHEQGDYDPQDYLNTFGGWDDALLEAGLDPDEAKVKITDLKLLAELQRLEQDLGQTPTQEDVAEHGKYSHETYRSRFGSYNAAIEQAMLSTNEISEAELLRDLERVADDRGRPPTVEEMNDYGTYAAVTYHRRFGSWRDALNEADFELDQRRVSDNQLLADLRRLDEELGETPTGEDIDTEGVFSRTLYHDRFGTLNEARMAAGLETTEQEIPDSDLLADLRRITEDIGHEPAEAEIDEHSEYGIATFYRHFDSLDDARSRALD